MQVCAGLLCICLNCVVLVFVYMCVGVSVVEEEGGGGGGHRVCVVWCCVMCIRG